MLASIIEELSWGLGGDIIDRTLDFAFSQLANQSPLVRHEIATLLQTVRLALGLLS